MTEAARESRPTGLSWLPSKPDDTKGTVYHAIGSPFHGYTPEVKPSYDISKTKRVPSRVSLGVVHGTTHTRLAEIAKSVVAPDRSPSPLDPFAVTFAKSQACWSQTDYGLQGDNCQKWAVDFLNELVRLGAIDRSVLNIVESCPKE